MDERVAPEIAELISRRGRNWPATVPISVEAARRREQAIAELVMWDEPDVDHVEELVSANEGFVTVRVYRPHGGGPKPPIVYFHGGGWVAGSLDSFHPLAQRLAAATRSVVLAPQLALAPEASHHAACDQAVAVFDEIVERAEDMGLPSADVGLAGDSTGGHVAACVARRAMSVPAFLVLAYPVLDAATSGASYEQFAEGFGVTRDVVQWWWTQYAAHDECIPGGSAAFTEALRGCGTPTCILTAECDPARDDGERFAAALAESDVPVRLRRFPGMVHDFLRMPCTSPAIAAGFGEIAAFVDRALVRRTLDATQRAHRETLRLNGS